MFANHWWRRRLQRHVGPGHGRRRDVGMPHREHGRDLKVADTDRDVTGRDPATGHTARDPATGHTARDDHPHGMGHTGRDPATGPTARDDHPPRRDRRPAIPHATIHTARDPATGYPTATGHTGRHDRQRTIPHATILSYPTMPGNARKCPEMPGLCSVILDDVWLTRLSGNRITG